MRLLPGSCWGWNRTAEGEYQADPSRFPPAADGTPGMRVVADYLHERGLKFGLYTDGGEYTCSKGERAFEIPGSYGHWDQDAKTFAAVRRAQPLATTPTRTRVGVVAELRVLSVVAVGGLRVHDVMSAPVATRFVSCSSEPIHSDP